jgi:hypothetical protein
MIGSSVYLRGNSSDVQAFAKLLNIAGQNVFDASTPINDFSFYDRQENSMKFAVVRGDFDYICYVDLFDLPQEMLIEQLRLVSSHGLVLAIPDDASVSPFDCILFENGHKEAIELLEDDVLEEVRIHRPKQKALQS